MKAYRELLAKIKRADNLFNLIEPDDKIVVGISGGKDSIVLFEALVSYQKYAKKPFTLIPVMLDLGFDHFNADRYLDHFKKLGYDLIINDSQTVAKILHVHQAEHNLPKLPCSICSRMKKAAINRVAQELGANKVAFAHHIDDALETLVMNMISGGRLATFKPKMHLERANITFIRPLLLVDEESIIKVQTAFNLPLLAYTCPNNKKTRREDIKNLLNDIYTNYPEAKQNFQLMLTNDEALELWTNNFATLLQKDLVIKKASSPALLSDALYIRTKVFIEEQGISVDDEFDTKEEDYTSYVLYLKDDRVGTIRYHLDKTKKIVHLGRIAVLKEYRSRGYAKLLIKYLEEELRTKYRPLNFVIGGQKHLQTYYESLGYTVTGEPYIDAGIPHVTLTKTLN